MIPAISQGSEDPRWTLCPPSGVAPAPEPVSEEQQQQLHLKADRVEALGDNITRFSGNVEIEYQGNRIHGERAEYNKQKGEVTIDGNITLNGQSMIMSGERASIDPSGESGIIEKGEYHIRDSHAFGRAEEIVLIDRDHAEMKEMSYTTCPPGKEGWLLKANSLELDYATNTGEAWNTTLRFKGVPFIYIPYINFPLHGRKSGLLAPSAGTSDSRGTDITVPYYWNIAPHRDATIGLRNMSARGAMVESEFRYLNPSNHGQINLDYMHEDKKFDDEMRWSGHLEHYGKPGKGWQTTLLYNGVSDDEYFNDLGSSQAATSLSHLERRADLSYQSTHWSLLARAQGYQSLTDDQPYQRLPQLKLTAATPERRGRPTFSFDGEVVNFDKNDDLATTGFRADLYPAVTMPLESDAWFLKPRLALRYTGYQLENALEEKPARTLPIASIDSGLFFERDLKLGDTPYLQTLEPRLYYLYVPYRDQDDLPVFDTSAYDFTFRQLFRENRFNGADRHGDTNQLTLALTTRFIDGKDGREKLNASLGQVLYFEDREVTLPGSVIETESDSPYVGGLNYRPTSSLDLTATTRYNAQDGITEVLSTRFRYQPGRDKSLSMGYLLGEELDQEQADIAAYWPLTPHWQFLGRWQYDLKQKRDLDVVAGLEYRSCCWGMRIIGRELLNTTTGEPERSIYFTFEFKGLSRIGNDLDSELERGILGR